MSLKRLGSSLGRRVTASCIVASCLCASIVATGGGASASVPSARDAAGTTKPLRIVGVVAQITDPYFISIACGAKAAATALGNVSVSFQGPTSASVPQEITTLDSVAVTKPDGVILDPFDPNSFISPVRNLMNEGIPVYTVDAWLNKDVSLGATYTDVQLSAPTLANSIAGIMHGHGQLAIIAFGAGDPFEGPRYLYMVKDLKREYPKISVLPVQYASSDENKAAQVTSGLLVRYPNLSAIYATDGPAGEGAVAALRTEHLLGKVKVVAFDAEPLQVQSLRSGDTSALYAQAPYVEGYTAVEHIVRYLRSHTSGSKVPPASPYYVPSPQKFITGANLTSAATQPYLYKASC
jgi:ribose transport system substrate-binding protein